jgi:hypothetical protein
MCLYRVISYTNVVNKSLYQTFSTVRERKKKKYVYMTTFKPALKSVNLESPRKRTSQ